MDTLLSTVISDEINKLNLAIELSESVTEG